MKWAVYLAFLCLPYVNDKFVCSQGEENKNILKIAFVYIVCNTERKLFQQLWKKKAPLLIFDVFLCLFCVFVCVFVIMNRYAMFWMNDAGTVVGLTHNFCSVLFRYSCCAYKVFFYFFCFFFILPSRAHMSEFFFLLTVCWVCTDGSQSTTPPLDYYFFFSLFHFYSTPHTHIARLLPKSTKVLKIMRKK